MRARLASGALFGGLAGVVLLAGAAPPVAAEQATGEHRVLSVSGQTQVQGQPAVVDILVDVAPGQDPALVGQNALAAVRAAPVGQPGMSAAPLGLPAVPILSFTRSRLAWPQFLNPDRGTNDDFVLQFYNPAGDPTGGLAQRAITNSETTWSRVESSRARFRFGGTTNRCPFSFPQCVGPRGSLFDGFNDFAWVDFAGIGSNVLGETITTFRTTDGSIVKADVALNPRFAWFTDPATAQPGSFDVESTALHENGHVLGLEHSRDPTAVMYAFLSALEVRRTLAPDDISAISSLYPLHPPRPMPITGPLTTIAKLGDPAPGFANTYDFDFEPYQLADNNTAAYAADLTNRFRGPGEGVFLFWSRGGTLLAKTGQPAPGGGTFGDGVLSNVGLNNAGDAAFSFLLSPSSSPSGLNAGVYRYSSRDASLAAIVVPFVTAAPGGGAFLGAIDHAAINEDGSVVFAGIIPTTQGISGGLGAGVFRAARDGTITSVVSPGDPAPDGGTFDFAAAPSINARGDIAFGAHVRGEECFNPNPPGAAIYCRESLYLKRAGSDRVESIAHRGAAAPGGGVFQYSLAPVINGQGDVVFVANTTPTGVTPRTYGVFLYSGGALTRIAGTGDPMPGGGTLVATSRQPGNWSINDAGSVAFSAQLDTDTLGTGNRDTGLYVWSHGALRVVARTGTDLPGLGTVLALSPPDFVGGPPFSGAALNNRGMILFDATIVGPPAQPMIGVLVEKSIGESD